MISLELLEGNKLMVKFMGFQGGQCEEWCECNIIEFDDWVGEEILRPYRPHVKWDDLMPVVNKLIEVLPVRASHRIRQQFLGKIDSVPIDIESVYATVVHYIKWHNQNAS